MYEMIVERLYKNKQRLVRFTSQKKRSRHSVNSAFKKIIGSKFLTSFPTLFTLAFFLLEMSIKRFVFLIRAFFLWPAAVCS